MDAKNFRPPARLSCTFLSTHSREHRAAVRCSVRTFRVRHHRAGLMAVDPASREEIHVESLLTGENISRTVTNAVENFLAFPRSASSSP